MIFLLLIELVSQKLRKQNTIVITVEIGGAIIIIVKRKGVN